MPKIVVALAALALLFSACEIDPPTTPDGGTGTPDAGPDVPANVTTIRFRNETANVRSCQLSYTFNGETTNLFSDVPFQPNEERVVTDVFSHDPPYYFGIIGGCFRPDTGRWETMNTIFYIQKSADCLVRYLEPDNSAIFTTCSGGN